MVASIALAGPKVISNPVADGTIRVDGKLSDWYVRVPFPDDSDEDDTASDLLDWERAAIAHDRGQFYFYYRNRRPLVLEGTAFNAWVDTDSSRATGFRGALDDFPIGADFMVQGSTVHAYTGSGTDWSWSPVANAAAVVTNREVEMSFPRSVFGSTTKIDVVFYGDNTAYDSGGTLIDLYPDAFTSPPGAGPYFSYAVTQTVSNPVARAAVSVDGAFTDWDALQSFGPDGDEPGTAADLLDWDEAWMAHDETSVYVSYKTRGPSRLDGAYDLFLDTDATRWTGFRGGSDELPIGAEYLLQGATLYRYSGTGMDWTWTGVATATSALSGDRAELTFSRSLLGAGATRIDLCLLGVNAAYPGGALLDLYPDNATRLGAGRFFSYLLGGAIRNPVAQGAVAVDGTFADWASLWSFGTDPADSNANWLDWREAWMAHDASKFFLSYRTGGAAQYNWGTSVFLDTDENSYSGFRGGGNDFPVGAEYLIQGNDLIMGISVYRYAGTGNDWSWSWVADAPSALVSDRVELSVARRDLGGPAGIRLFFYGDNGAFGGSGVDLFPDNALSASGPGKLLIYSTR